MRGVGAVAARPLLVLLALPFAACMRRHDNCDQCAVLVFARPEHIAAFVHVPGLPPQRARYCRGSWLILRRVRRVREAAAAADDHASAKRAERAACGSPHRRPHRHRCHRRRRLPVRGAGVGAATAAAIAAATAAAAAIPTLPPPPCLHVSALSRVPSRVHTHTMVHTVSRTTPRRMKMRMNTANEPCLPPSPHAR